MYICIIYCYILLILILIYSDDQSRKAYIMDDWTVGAFSESLEEKVKKLNLYRIPEFPKDTFIKPRKQAEYWPPHMVPSNQLAKTKLDSIKDSDNSVVSSCVNNNVAPSNTNENLGNVKNSTSSETETRNQINQSMNTSSNETINDFILVELVNLLITNLIIVFLLFFY